LQQIGNAIQQRGAIGDGGGAPCPVVECRPGRRDGRPRVFGCRFIDNGGDTAGRGVDDVAGTAVGGVAPLAADPEIGSTVHGLWIPFARRLHRHR
jgi:hypothetical protein